MNDNGTNDIARLRNLRSTLLEMELPGATAYDSEALASCRADIRAIDAYERSSRDAGDPAVDALSAELRQRELLV